MSNLKTALWFCVALISSIMVFAGSINESFPNAVSNGVMSIRQYEECSYVINDSRYQVQVTIHVHLNSQKFYQCPPTLVLYAKQLKIGSRVRNDTEVVRNDTEVIVGGVLESYSAEVSVEETPIHGWLIVLAIVSAGLIGYYIYYEKSKED